MPAQARSHNGGHSSYRGSRHCAYGPGSGCPHQQQECTSRGARGAAKVRPRAALSSTFSCQQRQARRNVHNRCSLPCRRTAAPAHGKARHLHWAVPASWESSRPYAALGCRKGRGSPGYHKLGRCPRGPWHLRSRLRRQLHRPLHRTLRQCQLARMRQGRLPALCLPAQLPLLPLLQAQAPRRNVLRVHQHPALQGLAPLLQVHGQLPSGIGVMVLGLMEERWPWLQHLLPARLVPHG